MNSTTMRIGDLARASGVSARTIRYYIVEGLLPPPDGAGLGASYDQSHLDRLRLIRHLKDTYLPLREIRRQLTGLDDAAVRARLAELDHVPPSSTSTRSTGSAEGSLRRLASRPSGPASRAEARSQIGIGELGSGVAPDASRAHPETAVPWTGIAKTPRPDSDMLPGSGLTVGVTTPLSAPLPPPEEPIADADANPAAENWIRLKLGDDVELLVRSGAYYRLRDRIDWLAGWARAIFR